MKNNPFKKYKTMSIDISDLENLFKDKRKIKAVTTFFYGTSV